MDIPGDRAVFADVRARWLEMLDELKAATEESVTRSALTLHSSWGVGLENAGLCLHPVYGFAYPTRHGLKGLACCSRRRSGCRRGPRGSEAGRCRSGRCSGPRTGSRGVPGGRLSRRLAGGIAPAGGRYRQQPSHRVLPGGGRRRATGNSPIPVYFLVVAPGTAFTFALGKRDCEWPLAINAPVVRACQWLWGGSALLGCGAKTAAGYGIFAGNSGWLCRRSGRGRRRRRSGWSRPASWPGPSSRRKIATAATLRGQWRWWRTLHAGCLTVPELNALESALWGDTERGGAIQVVVEPSADNPPPERYAYRDGVLAKADFGRAHHLAFPPEREDQVVPSLLWDGRGSLAAVLPPGRLPLGGAAGGPAGEVRGQPRGGEAEEGHRGARCADPGGPAPWLLGQFGGLGCGAERVRCVAGDLPRLAGAVGGRLPGTGGRRPAAVAGAARGVRPGKRLSRPP